MDLNHSVSSLLCFDYSVHMCVCVCVCVCVQAHASGCTKLLLSCPTLCDAMDCNPPGSSVHGILHARILEWVAKPSSRGSSQPRDHISSVSCIGKWVPLLPPGKPLDHTIQLKILSIPLLSYISHTSLCR